MGALTVHSSKSEANVKRENTTLRRDRDAAELAQAAYNRSEAFRQRSSGHTQNVLALLRRAELGEVA